MTSASRGSSYPAKPAVGSKSAARKRVHHQDTHTVYSEIKGWTLTINTMITNEEDRCSAMRKKESTELQTNTTSLPFAI